MTLDKKKKQIDFIQTNEQTFYAPNSYAQSWIS